MTIPLDLAPIKARAEADSRDWRMGAYYYSFERTSIGQIDKILSEVAGAGKAYHHTQDWNEPRGDGSSWEGAIQAAAYAAAQDVSALIAEVERLRNALLEIHRANANAAISGYRDPKALDRLYAAQGPACDVLGMETVRAYAALEGDGK